LNVIEKPGVMRRPILLFTLIFCLLSVSQHNEAQQDNKKPSPKERIFFGGNLGLVFGTVTHIEVSPMVGYYLTPRLSAGVGVIYEYFRNRYYLPNGTNIYGGNVFASYMIIRNINEFIPIGSNFGIYARVEQEALSLERKYFDPFSLQTGDRYLLHSTLVGGGLRVPAGKRSAMTLSVLYNLNESSGSRYINNPIIRVGFEF
jgi:hypothetical protein